MSPPPGAASDPLPLSALNDFLFCPRRAWLKFVEGLRGTNEHTVLGNLVHEHVDFPGYEQRANWTLLRALPLFSDRLGLSGKADLVEIRYGESDRIAEARPVEYKKGPKRRFDNDEVQLCAQALCLEEMFGVAILGGAIYHAQSQQRHEVAFGPTLRQQTLNALTGLRTLLAQTAPPLAELKPQCEGCSLHDVCLPEAAHRRAPRLFEPRAYV
ncbi:MAG: CRISPR-associated protein Cas4 [Opitutaceae bacterium]